MRRVGVSGDAGELRAAERLVLPGVGAAAPAMAALRERGLDRAIAGSGAPLLGVCLGMQLLFERSAEGGVDCLGLLPGEVVAIDWAQRVPHMGWNDVVGDGEPAVCYFAHSYAVRLRPPRWWPRTRPSTTARCRPWFATAGSAASSSTPRRAPPTAAACWRRWLAA